MPRARFGLLGLGLFRSAAFLASAVFFASAAFFGRRLSSAWRCRRLRPSRACSTRGRRRGRHRQFVGLREQAVDSRQAIARHCDQRRGELWPVVRRSATTGDRRRRNSTGSDVAASGVSDGGSTGSVATTSSPADDIWRRGGGWRGERSAGWSKAVATRRPGLRRGRSGDRPAAAAATACDPRSAAPTRRAELVVPDLLALGWPAQDAGRRSRRVFAARRARRRDDARRDRGDADFARVGEDAEMDRRGLLRRGQCRQQAEEARHARSRAGHRLVDRARRAALVADQRQDEGADALRRGIAPRQQRLERGERAGAVARDARLSASRRRASSASRPPSAAR